MPIDKPSFAERLTRLLGRVEHGIATTVTAREAVYRLRFEAYERNKLIEPREGRRLCDEKYDNAPNSLITTTFVDGVLAGTTRVSFGADETAIAPCLKVYPDVVGPRIRGGRVFIELTRLAANYEIAREFPELIYLVIRPAYMAAAHFDVDLAIASPRAEHMAFYQRVFNFEPWCPPRDYPGMTVQWACMGMEFQKHRESVERRYPFYRSSAAEREALFGPRSFDVVGQLLKAPEHRRRSAARTPEVQPPLA